MPATFGFFHDSAATRPINSSDPLTADQDTDLSLPATDKTIYFGSTAASKKVQSASGPGTTPISVTPTVVGSGPGPAITEIKLALSSGGLASAVAGAALEIGTTVNSGVANAVPIYVRWTSVTSAVGMYPDSLVPNSGIVLNTQTLAETAL